MKMNNESKLRHWLGKVLRVGKVNNHYFKNISVRQFMRIFIIKWINWALSEDTDNWKVYHIVNEPISVPENLRECLKEYVLNRLTTDFRLFCDVAWDMGYVPKWLCNKWVTVDLPAELKDELCPWTGNGHHIVRTFARSLNEDAKKVGGRFMYSCTEYAYDSDNYVLVLPKGKKLTWSMTTKVNGVVTEKKEIELG